MVSALDFRSNDPGSSPGRAFGLMQRLMIGKLFSLRAIKNYEPMGLHKEGLFSEGFLHLGCPL